ncbi:hypothetical protein HYH02_011705 [Chlamydomonas schloesseri]|uniref:Protein kinase domain-containing protein n=1 Tax=Chlamydomonas schloesseri TaxID=2026947 RepID=A0A835T2T8_9CHLO|nr:hypothetical protein HYH02_011705 [Chlamydomonas schloesseri]|eukprot:KAG2435992.1 hypothetical protein HYH02_011705 [Chlamydomonas schloesseri]
MAKTQAVFTPSQFVDALTDESVNKVLVETPLLILAEDVFQQAAVDGVQPAIRLARAFTVVGSPDLPEPPTIRLFARHKIQLQPGVTFAFFNVVVQYYITDSPARAPNFYIFAPSTAPNLGPHGTRVLMQDSVLLLGVGLPIELRKQNVLSVKRPAWEGPGPQDIEWMSQGRLGEQCINDTAAPLLDRCWYPRRDLYKDVAFTGGDTTADGAVIPNNVSIHFLNSTLLARQEVASDCISSLGPYGCLVYTYRDVRSLPPVPLSASMAAILAQQQQQQQQLPAAPPPVLDVSGAGASGGGSGSSQTTWVLTGAIVGGVVGGALLVGVAAAVLWSRRRKRSGAPPDTTGEGKQQPLQAVADSSSSDGSSASCAQQQLAQNESSPQEASDSRPAGAAAAAPAADTLSRSLGRGPSAGLQQPQWGDAAAELDHSSQRLHGLVVRSAPLREGLGTNLIVVTQAAAGDDGSPTTLTGSPRPWSATTGSRPGGSKSSSIRGARCSGSSGNGGHVHGAGAGGVNQAGAAAAAAVDPPASAATTTAAGPLVVPPAGRRQPSPLPAGSPAGGGVRSAAFCDSSSDGAFASAGGGGLATRVFASRVAALLLESSSNVGGNESLFMRTPHWHSSTYATADEAGEPAGTTDYVMITAGVSGAPATSPPPAAEGDGSRGAGTPAAAVSLGLLGHGCGEDREPQPVQVEMEVEVEVVELLPHKLGKGTFGRVQEGRYRGQRVAVKQALDLHDGLEMPVTKVVEAFLQEVEVMGRCQHPNICQLLAACLAPPKLCLVMEFMDTNLEALIYGGGPSSGRRLLPLPKLLHIAIQVAQGLEYLHPTCIHRDLKPANVLITNPDCDKPIVKLADFGLSRLAEVTVLTANPEAGTPAYMAPETFDVQNHKVTHKVDMYAFGILLWAMLTGEEPWRHHPMISVAYNVFSGRRPPLSGLPEDRCPRKLLRLIEQCWDAQPRRRPAAAEAMKELLLIREHMANGDVAAAHPPAAVS